MTDILVTFPDGTSELRAPDSACLWSLFDPPSRHPSEERWYLYFPDEARPLSFLARPVAMVRDVRGAHDVYVWRLTGHTEEPYTLTGEWQAVHVETVDEQLSRLTRERDILDFACDGYEQELTHLRRAARQAIAAIDGRDPGDVKASTLAAFLRDIAGRT